MTSGKNKIIHICKDLPKQSLKGYKETSKSDWEEHGTGWMGWDFQYLYKIYKCKIYLTIWMYNLLKD